MAHWDRALLELIDRTEEVTVQATGESGWEDPVIIWAVTAGDDVYVRSYLGERGQWWRDVQRHGSGRLIVAGQTIDVMFTRDDSHDDDVDAAFLRAYATSPHAATMVAPEQRATTLRVDPV